MDCFKNDYECLEKMNNPPKKSKKPFNKVFEVKKKTLKCPKGFKVCNCNPKKPKCKKIKKTNKK